MMDSAEEYLLSKIGSKLDIMNIVMKRHIGGSNDNSPVKRRKTEDGNEIENALNNDDLNVNYHKDEGDSSVNSTDRQELDVNYHKDENDSRISSTEKYSNSKDSKDITEKDKPEYRSEHSPKKAAGGETVIEASKSSLEHAVRSDKLHSHSTDGQRSEPIILPSGNCFENESPGFENTVFLKSDADTDKPYTSSEIRVRIPPTVYKNKRESREKLQKLTDEVIDENSETEGNDETDGGTNGFHKGFRGDDNCGEVTSHYFRSDIEHRTKKSRKQTVPKKISTTDQSSHNCSDFSNNIHSTHEKSRKQSAPKRKHSHMLINDGKEIEKAGKEPSAKFVDISKFKVEKSTSRKQGTPRKLIQEHNSQTVVDSIKFNHSSERETDTMDQEADDSSVNDSRDSTGSDKNSDVKNPKQNHINQFLSPYFSKSDFERPESYLTPEILRLSQQIALQKELLAKLSQSHVQMPDKHLNVDNLNLDSDPLLSDSLAFVKKLREIRVNRYRKISISEKKHIASFAKIHGISAAANYFGVSKSAVSMWNRTDFSEKDEVLEKKKRNCLIGNEKFENLVQRVKLQKPTKFKHLLREDKVEVAKYAKLVGVREMSRCLGIALGTVSGWMRQFPYEIKANTEESKEAGISKDSSSKVPSQTITDASNKVSENNAVTDNRNPENSDAVATLNKNECETGIPCSSNVDSSNIMIKREGISESQTCKANYVNINDNLSKDAGLLEMPCLVTQKEKLNSELENTKVKLETVSCGFDMISNTCVEGNDKVCYQNQNMQNDIANCHISISEENKSDKHKLLNELRDHLSDCSAKAENVRIDNARETGMNTNHIVDNEKKLEYPTDTDIENMIASSFIQPDLDKCFAEAKDQIAGTVLEDDAYFEHLFKRVTATRIDKYKSLKRSEKLEIVRYAKRIGVRRVAKIMDLATGTLSGWIIKYQHLLGLVSSGDVENSQNSSTYSDLDVDNSVNASIGSDPETMQTSENQMSNNLLQTPSSILDNTESTEVTALKFLLKERFPLLQEKIDIARKVKFKNLNIGEKVELVKCAKLVGIRPTARVFQMPLGTLSGWISKYSCFLEPEFQGVSQGSATCPNSNAWLINSLDNSLGRLNESDLGTSTPIKIAPHLQWTNESRIEENENRSENERSESPYSKMMAEMAEKTFSNISKLYTGNYRSDDENGKTNILNRRLSVEWPKLSSQEETDSQSEISWPKLKFPNGATEPIKAPNSDVGFPNFLLQGFTNSYNDETTKAMAQQYLQQFGTVQFSDT